MDLQRSRASAYYQLYVRSEQPPDPESRITLSQARDPLGMRRPILNWHVGKRVHSTIGRGLELLAGAFGHARLGRVYSFLHAQDESRVGAWPEFAGGYHHMGTTRMGSDPAHSVVDRDCRVHGMENLYIAGSSVFTTAGFSNPTLTLLALALRLAKHLEREAAA
ncbi:GMC family oxidoreductase [Myxococcota bacterium]